MRQRVRMGTRASLLAQKQAHWIGDSLRQAGYEVSYHDIQTAGDLRPEVPLGALDTQGIFTKALEEALLEDRIDLAVHSAKDMPASLDESFAIIAFSTRLSAHDVLAVPPARKHEVLAGGELKACCIGTSSSRRQAQLGEYFPQVQSVPARGNIQTRLKHLEEGKYDALMLAHAALARSELSAWEGCSFLPSVIVPAAAQGALALEVLRERAETPLFKGIRKQIHHAPTSWCVEAERAFLATLGAGCHTPAFAYARLNQNQDPAVLCLHAGKYVGGRRLDYRLSVPWNDTPSTSALKLGKQVAEHVHNQTLLR